MFPMSGALLHHALQQAAAQFGGRTAVVAGDDEWTFRHLDERSTAFGRHLVARGVRPGDRVAMMTSNRPEFVVAIHGISKIGAAAVLLSPAWKSIETSHALELTAPVHAVADGPGVELLGVLLGAGRVTDLDQPEAVDAPFDADASPTGIPASDLDEVVLVFSSGTTGLPKAVRHTHRSICLLYTSPSPRD